MATTYNNIAIEMKHFNQIRQNIPRINEMNQDTLNILIEMGALQVSTLLELAIANVGDLDVISANEHDLSDGSEVKMATVRIHNYGKSYRANISNTKNKSGLIRAQVLEPITDRFYYFAIPHNAHSMVTGASNIEIPFHLDGRPRKDYKPRSLPNWWSYEVSSFEDVCNVSNLGH
jgi:hypothetical protein